jgi:hypothetical protein
MADSTDTAQDKRRLALNDYKTARHSLTRLLRMRFRGEIDTETYRDMIKGFQALLSYDKLEKEIDLERRLDALEIRAGAKEEVLTIGQQQARVELGKPERDASVREWQLMVLEDKARPVETYQQGIEPEPIRPIEPLAVKEAPKYTRLRI